MNACRALIIAAGQVHMEYVNNSYRRWFDAAEGLSQFEAEGRSSECRGRPAAKTCRGRPGPRSPVRVASAEPWRSSGRTRARASGQRDRATVSCAPGQADIQAKRHSLD